MLRNAVVMALGLGALAAAFGPLAASARAETPRQVWLQNHPVAAANLEDWRLNHPYRAGWPVVAPVGPIVVEPVVPVRVDPVIRVVRPGWRWYRW